MHLICGSNFILQMKLLEEEEKEKREEEERKERRRTKEREKKLRRKERLREKENREKKGAKSNLDPVVTDVLEEAPTPPVDEEANNASSRESLSERGEDTPSSPLSPDIQDDQLSTEYTYSNVENPSENILDGEFINMRDWNTSLPYDHFKYSRRKLKFSQDSERDLNSKWSDRRKDSALSENGGVVSKYESRYHADGFEPTRSFNGFNKHLRTNVARSNVRNGSKLSEKFQCGNSRIGDKYASHYCNCDHHHEFRSRPDSHMVRVARDPKYINKLESPSDTSKPYYRGKKYAQVQCARETNGRPKSKIITANPVNTKKVWEPLDSQKKYIRSNSDSDVTLRSTTKVEASESDQLPECCSTSSDEVRSISIQTNPEDNDTTDLTVKPGDYSKEAVAEDGQICCHSNSNKCPSCLSEGDSNMYSNPQNLESTSTSDSEESSQHSEGRETSHCLSNGTAASHGVVEDQCTTGVDVKSQGPASAGTKALDSCLKETASPYYESGRANLSVGPQPQCVLPQVHNQINYPIFQAPPTMSYYHQNPVSWPAANAGLISYPHANHYLFANTYGYGFNGNARLMQCGAIQHVVPPLMNRGHVPVFQPVSQFNTKESPKVAHTTQKVASHDQQPTEAATVVDPGKPDKMEMENNGFSLFHFGGPVAYSTGFKADEVTLKECTPGDASPNSPANSPDGDRSCNEKDSVEEYNLFATTNGIQFSIF